MVPRPKMLVEGLGGPDKRNGSPSDSDSEEEIYTKPEHRHHTSMTVERRNFPFRRKFVQLLSRLRSIDTVSPSTALLLLVLIDMFAVSLVVPLLFQYYKSAGVNNAGQRELLSSLFSTSQIVGGLLMGFVTDARFVRRRSLLFISFAGSALSYALIAYGGFTALICSRVLVGLVKQTMTVTTAMLTSCTTRQTSIDGCVDCWAICRGHALSLRWYKSAGSFGLCLVCSRRISPNTSHHLAKQMYKG